MKAAALAIALSLPSTASADAIDDLFSARCSGVLNIDARLLNDGAREAYLAMLASWILFSNALKTPPPLDAVCAEKPNLTVREAMQEAISRVVD